MSGWGGDELRELGGGCGLIAPAVRGNGLGLPWGVRRICGDPWGHGDRPSPAPRPPLGEDAPRGLGKRLHLSLAPQKIVGSFPGSLESLDLNKEHCQLDSKKQQKIFKNLFLAEGNNLLLILHCIVIPKFSSPSFFWTNHSGSRFCVPAL